MIDRLAGTIVLSEPGRVVVDVHGVGYQVLVPARDSDRLPVGSERVVLYTHVVYGEDRQELFGFLTVRERDVFRQLLSVAGVGPRTGMAVLSGFGVDQLREAILREDRKSLLRIPGIGGKLADRLLLELRDKAPGWAAEVSGAAPAAGPGMDDERAVQALAGMGYRTAQAAHAVELARAKLGAEATFEQILRQALLEALR